MALALAVVVAMVAECGLCSGCELWERNECGKVAAEAVVLALVVLLVQRGNHWRSQWSRWLARRCPGALAGTAGTPAGPFARAPSIKHWRRSACSRAGFGHGTSAALCAARCAAALATLARHGASTWRLGDRERPMLGGEWASLARGVFAFQYMDQMDGFWEGCMDGCHRNPNIDANNCGRRIVVGIV